MKDFIFVIYKIMPFIMVAYLLITAIFAGSFAGILVLTGLVISSIIVISVTSLIQEPLPQQSTLFSFNQTSLSKLPLSTSTFGYMFAYFTTVVIKNGLVSSNWFLITALTLILIGDLVFQNYNGVGKYAIFPAAIGVIVGLIWASILPKESQMIPQSYEQSKCNTKKGIYRCRIRKTGEVL